MLSTSVKITHQLSRSLEKKEIINCSTGCDFVLASISPTITTIDTLNFNSNAAYIYVKNEHYIEVWYVNRANRYCSKLIMNPETLEQFDKKVFPSPLSCTPLSSDRLKEIHEITGHNHIYLQDFFVLRNGFFLKVFNNGRYSFTNDLREEKQPAVSQSFNTKKMFISQTHMLEISNYYILSISQEQYNSILLVLDKDTKSVLTHHIHQGSIYGIVSISQSNVFVMGETSVVYSLHESKLHPYSEPYTDINPKVNEIEIREAIVLPNNQGILAKVWRLGYGTTIEILNPDTLALESTLPLVKNEISIHNNFETHINGHCVPRRRIFVNSMVHLDETKIVFHVTDHDDNDREHLYVFDVSERILCADILIQSKFKYEDHQIIKLNSSCVAVITKGVADFFVGTPLNKMYVRIFDVLNYDNPHINELCLDAVEFLRWMPNKQQFVACDVNGGVTFYVMRDDLRKVETEKYFLSNNSSQHVWPKEVIKLITDYANFGFFNPQTETSNISLINDSAKKNNSDNGEDIKPANCCLIL
ncbi:MAG: hypothetical protein JO131_03340 [Gammaproteobacteria bacterium]|nr:hypothetical protein [Gammaproteobacteria bacterium]